MTFPNASLADVDVDDPFDDEAEPAVTFEQEATEVACSNAFGTFAMRTTRTARYA